MATKTRKTGKSQGAAKRQPPGASAPAEPRLGPSPSPAAPAHPRPAPASRGPMVRVLPLLILVGGLMLSVRVTDLFKGMFGAQTISVAELQAQQAPKPAEATPPAQAQSPAPQQTAAATAAPSEAAADKAAPATPKPANAPAATSAGDGGGMTQTEMDVLQKLQERRNGLDLRERDIERREALLKAAEDQIDRKLSEMKTLQTTIEGLLRQYNDQEDNKMRSLVKIYENMKPKEAAKIFEQLDMSILLEVLERMKEQRVAPILAEMDPSKAKSVTAELAQRRQIPMPKATPGG